MQQKLIIFHFHRSMRFTIQSLIFRLAYSSNFEELLLSSSKKYYFGALRNVLPTGFGFLGNWGTHSWNDMFFLELGHAQLKWFVFWGTGTRAVEMIFFRNWVTRGCVSCRWITSWYDHTWGRLSIAWVPSMRVFFNIFLSQSLNR